MYLKLFLVTSVLVALAFMMLAIRMLLVRGGKFPNTSVSGNKHLRGLGLTCAKCEEQAKYNRKKKRRMKINPVELKLIQE